MRHFDLLETLTIAGPKAGTEQSEHGVHVVRLLGQTGLRGSGCRRFRNDRGLLEIAPLRMRGSQGSKMVDASAAGQIDGPLRQFQRVLPVPLYLQSCLLSSYLD